MNRAIKEIIVHCSASSFGCVREIRIWHIQRGFMDVGYHFVILNGQAGAKIHLEALDGSIEIGRHLDEIGAHCVGHNADSIGVCAIGKDGVFIDKQMDSLIDLLASLCGMYSLTSENVIGHSETDSGKEQGKTCPDMIMDVIRHTLQTGLSPGNEGKEIKQ